MKWQFERFFSFVKLSANDKTNWNLQVCKTRQYLTGIKTAKNRKNSVCANYIFLDQLLLKSVAV